MSSVTAPRILPLLILAVIAGCSDVPQFRGADGGNQPDAGPDGSSSDRPTSEDAPNDLGDTADVTVTPADAGPGGNDAASGDRVEAGDGGLPNGMSCSQDQQCMFGRCVDGYCCETVCTGQCESCAEVGNLGKCLTVTGAPRSGRTSCGGTPPCASACDGTDPAACTYPRSSMPCAPGRCLNGSVTTATSCNGGGACTAATTSSCPSNQCADGSRCSGGCSASLPCGPGRFCDATGVCLTTKLAGVSCQSGSECISTFCVDGVCCEGACSGQCQGCNEPGRAGMCTTVSGMPRVGRVPCAGTQAICAGRCDGVSPAACSYADATTVCVATKCSGNLSMDSASVCNGNGSCTVVTTAACPSGRYCAGGACVAQMGAGGTCQNNDQCTSANCSGNICCPTGSRGCAGTGACVPAGGCCSDMDCPAASPVCNGTMTCVKRAAGSPCTTAGECANSVCPLCYPDRDGDTFGDTWSAPIARVCNPCPALHVPNNRDCMDNPAFVNAHMVNPNAGFHNATAPAEFAVYPTDPRDTSPDQWDWDCDDVRTLQIPTAGTGCTATASCANACPAATSAFTGVTCGQFVPLFSCINNCSTSGMCTATQTGSMPQGCK